MSKAPLGLCLIAALLLCVNLFLPAAAEARAGFTHGGAHMSIGSRGARTHEPGIGQPLHSYTRTPAPASAGPTARHFFLTGLFGGLLGAFLFGHGGLFGLSLLIVLVFLLWSARGWWGPRRSAASATLFSGPLVAPRHAAPAPPDRGRDIALPDADLDAFQKLHAAIQDAWSNADLARLSQLTTPEMRRWFAAELSRNATEGVRNVVSDVVLLKGELSESWEEGDRQYATAYMRWRAFDYRVRLGRSPGDPDYLVSGSPRVPVEAEEIWTFMRRRGDPWVVSAIQQV
ncbi:MAG TPA: TIM44-like domain-containing protein [Stellaceae bacterium]|nr:TIM44-like domain-containing protein [Stellaceae bacterium]